MSLFSRECINVPGIVDGLRVFNYLNTVSLSNSRVTHVERLNARPHYTLYGSSTTGMLCCVLSCKTTLFRVVL